jgi:hypothetical protein
MSEVKTVQKRVKPISVQCGAPGCGAKAEAVAMYTDDECEVVAPRGWTFAAPQPTPKGDVVGGLCPAHARR